MRTNLTVSLCLLALIVLCGILLEEKTEEVSLRYVSAAEEIRALAQDERWKQASDAVSAYRKDWEKTMKWMQLLVNHTEGDDVTMSLSEIETAVVMQDLQEVMLQCSRLHQHALHLHHRDAFTWGNVL